LAGRVREKATQLQRLSKALDCSGEPSARDLHVAQCSQRVSLQKPLTGLAVEKNALFERCSGLIVTIEARQRDSEAVQRGGEEDLLPSSGSDRSDERMPMQYGMGPAFGSGRSHGWIMGRTGCFRRSYKIKWDGNGWNEI